MRVSILSFQLLFLSSRCFLPRWAHTAVSLEQTHYIACHCVTKSRRDVDSFSSFSSLCQKLILTSWHLHDVLLLACHSNAPYIFPAIWLSAVILADLCVMLALLPTEVRQWHFSFRVHDSNSSLPPVISTLFSGMQEKEMSDSFCALSGSKVYEYI